jgi:hypothetical protein
VKLHKSSIKFGRGVKLSPRFLGPFELVEKKGCVAYRLALLDSFRHMHDVFHVYVLRHYVSDPTHVIDMSLLQVSVEGALTMEHIRILYHHIRQLRHRAIDQVKVKWDNYSPHSATWDDAYDMHKKFPYCFDRLDIYIFPDTFITTFYITVQLQDKS